MNWFLAKIGSGNVGHISKLSGSFYADWLICWPKAMPRQLSCFFLIVISPLVSLNVMLRKKLKKQGVSVGVISKLRSKWTPAKLCYIMSYDLKP